MNEDATAEHERQLNLYRHGTAEEPQSSTRKASLLDSLKDQSVSTKFVYWTLEQQDATFQQEIAEYTDLPVRTIRYGLNKLEDASLISTRPYMQDPRKKQYNPTLSNVYEEVKNSAAGAAVTDSDRDVSDLRPSSKFVYRALEAYGPQTKQELHDHTLLPERTVRHGLQQLREEDMAAEISDPIRPIYTLDTGENE